MSVSDCFVVMTKQPNNKGGWVGLVTRGGDKITRNGPGVSRLLLSVWSN